MAEGDHALRKLHMEGSWRGMARRVLMMRRFAWLTDLHLDFVEPPGVENFLADVAAMKLDGVLLSGDIGDARTVTRLLEQIDDALQIPLYFVLGNHDYYFGSIAEVRASIQQLQARRPRLHFLTTSREPLPIGERSAVIGHDGWADGREGDYERSYVMMNDYKLIAELAPYPKMDRWTKLQELGDEAAAHLRHVLTAAAERYEQVVLVTHVPPTRSSCWYEGQISDDEWAPHFTCQAAGQVIVDVMPAYPHCRLTVLCGHTHGEGETRLLDNVTIFTGSARYGAPEVKRVLEIE